MRTTPLLASWAALTLVPLLVHAQVRFHPAQLEMAQTAAHSTYLTAEEQAVFYYLNLARLNGKAFAATYLLPHFTKDSLTPETHAYLVSLVEELQASPSQQVLYPDALLTEAASAHADDLAQTGTFAHEASDGTPYGKRMGAYVKRANVNVKEALGSGYNDGLIIVIQLLIDYQVENLGHRRALLDPTMSRMGVSIAEHPRLGYVSVLELSTGPLNAAQAAIQGLNE